MTTQDKVINTAYHFLRNNLQNVREFFGNFVYFDIKLDAEKQYKRYGHAEWVELLGIRKLAVKMQTEEENCIPAFFLVDFKILKKGWKSPAIREDNKGICHGLICLRCELSEDMKECIKINHFYIYKRNYDVDMIKLQEIIDKKQVLSCTWDDMKTAYIKTWGWSGYDQWMPLADETDELEVPEEKFVDIDAYEDDEDPFEDDQDMEDLLYEDETDSEYLKMADKLKKGDDLLDTLSQRFRLNEKDVHRLRLYLNYRVQTDTFRELGRIRNLSVHLPYLNLLIHTNESDLGLLFVKEITDYFREDGAQTVVLSQAEEQEKIISLYAEKKPAKIDKLLRLSDNAVIIIKDCKTMPPVDKEAPTGSEVQNNKRSVAAYKDFWRLVGDAAKNFRNRPFFILAEDDAFQDLAYHCTEIYYRIFNTHIFLPETTIEDLLQKCLQDLKLDDFVLGMGFEEDLRRYFQAVYPKAELKGTEFVTDLINRIYVNYFRYDHSETAALHIITKDYIPYYRDNISGPEEILNELNALTGLQNVKQEFQNIYYGMAAGLEKETKSNYHMFFVGNPGTGKTTVYYLSMRPTVLMWTRITTALHLRF